MTKCYLAIQQRICCMQFKWNIKKKKDYTVITGKWKASVTRPKHFQNPIIKWGGGGGNTQNPYP